MIFDLLTIKDLYDRISAYPVPAGGSTPFITSGSITGHNVKMYRITEGWYFELINGGWEYVLCALRFKNVIPEGKQIHAIKLTYRSNRNLRFNNNVHLRVVLPKSDVLTTATILVNNFVSADKIFTIDCEGYPPDGQDALPSYEQQAKPGDYLIISKVELLSIKA